MEQYKLQGIIDHATDTVTDQLAHIGEVLENLDTHVEQYGGGLEMHLEGIREHLGAQEKAIREVARSLTTLTDMLLRMAQRLT